MIFFNETLPMLAKEHILKPNGFIILPNIQCVDENISNSLTELSQFYDIEKISNPYENPLYKATDLNKVNEELLSCPDMLTNETQLKPLNDEFPFFKLSNKHNRVSVSATSRTAVATAAVTVRVKRSTRRRIVNLEESSDDTAEESESSSPNHLDTSFSSQQSGDDSFELDESDDSNSNKASKFRKQIAILKRHSTAVTAAAAGGGSNKRSRNAAVSSSTF